MISCFTPPSWRSVLSAESRFELIVANTAGAAPCTQGRLIAPVVESVQPRTAPSTSLAPMSIVIGETFLPIDRRTSTAAWIWVSPGWFEWIANGYVVQPVVALVALSSVELVSPGQPRLTVFTPDTPNEAA